MSEFEVKALSSPSAKIVSPAVAALTSPQHGTNPVQDGFIRLEEAEQLRQQKKLERAQKICESLVRKHPDYMGALHTLGLIHADRNNYEQALNCLVRAAMLNPRSWKTLTALSGVYLRLNASEMAAQALEQARAIKPQDASVLVTLGEIYREEREYERAKDAYSQAAKLEENLVPAALGLGWIFSHIGQSAEAADVFLGLIKRGMRSLEVLHALTSLPASLVDVDLLAELDKVVSLSDEGNDKKFENSVAFVRAAALDKAGRYAEAWQQVDAANRTVAIDMRDELKERRESEQESFVRLREAQITARGNQKLDSTHPVSLFILGPSRSGKTTMEQLVATLDGVKRGYENPSVDNAVRRAMQAAGLLTSSHFEHLPAQLEPSCREIYREELSRRAGSAKVFTNTHPARIHDAIRMVDTFPNVRFIFIKRKMEDILFRIYQRQYTKGNAYAYDLKEARDHIIRYHQMIDLLTDKLQDIVRIIHYEDMVVDPARALRTAADLCGLPVQEVPLPALGDDRGCAEPYRQFMAPALEV